MAAIPIQPIIISALLYFFLCLLINNPAGCEAENILYKDEALYSGNSLQYGSNVLIMQEDCNLVLYRSYSPIWASNTGGMGSNCYCRMQSDGNLVIYEPPTQRTIWATNTGRDNGDYVLILQRDGNVVIYGSSVWSTGTYGAMNWLRITRSDEPKVNNSSS
ncbi:mannose-specific lectin-like [Macadamia integrifolia]|uniref:mannose-specific lectin-like n=1 Tax=Macadamia integrifolia TaxID=60698 RepID=UPI001C4FE535|nr:mannose-specific lectin-like [Macadamia integrifolia]